jgi:transposase
MIQDGKLRGFAMGQAVPVRTDYTAGEVRRFAQRAKDAAQARRLLAIAAVLDGASREEAATIGGMDRQTLRDWVIRFNEQGADGLISIPSPGVPPKLNSRHKAFLTRIVEEGPIPAIHGVVRWRACDLETREEEPKDTNPDRKCTPKRLPRHDIAITNREAGDEGEIDRVADRPALDKANQQAKGHLNRQDRRQDRPREMNGVADCY